MLKMLFVIGFTGVLCAFLPPQLTIWIFCIIVAINNYVEEVS